MTTSTHHTSLFSMVLTACLLTVPGAVAMAQNAHPSYNADQALKISQAAIGKILPDFELTNSDGTAVQLKDFIGKPLLISPVFTSCYHVCPALTRHLKLAVKAAREAVGEHKFQILTVGFDTAVDTPDRMREFAREQGVDDSEWFFLSGSAENVGGLMDTLGFVYFPTARGFDHITQISVVNQRGAVYRQVYGGTFELPWLVEPLKELIFNRPQSAQHFFSGIVDKVRLFCTVYDPSTGRYHIDYSIFIQIAIGALAIFSILFYLLLEIRRAKARTKGS